jgi:CDP-diacylglycerol---glycerol-3-phosphate 3-phosphatidyltransferase
MQLDIRHTQYRKVASSLVQTTSDNQTQLSWLPRLRSVVARRFTQPLVYFLSRTAITPDMISWFGFAVTLGGMVLIILGHLFAAAFAVLAGSALDMVDGALARFTQRTTRFGAVLDSVLDRCSEAALLIGIMAYYQQQGSFAGVMLVGVTLFFSQMVSYLRSRAEAIGLEGKEGLFTRPERIVTMVIGLLLARFPYALFTAVVVIGVFSLITMIQRLVLVWRQTRTN